jgi:hypothetical protein
LQRKFSLSIFALLVGLLVTLITGLVDVTPTDLVGATWYGLPLAWFYVIVYPGSPWRVDWVNFAGDLVLWVAVSFVIGLFVFRKRSHPNQD